MQLSFISRRLGRISTTRPWATIGNRNFGSAEPWTYKSAHQEVFNGGDAKVAFLGTGPMALSFAAQVKLFFYPPNPLRVTSIV